MADNMQAMSPVLTLIAARHRSAPRPYASISTSAKRAPNYDHDPLLAGGVLLHSVYDKPIMRKLIIAGASALMFYSLSAHAQPATETQQGLADREAWETWFASLSGEYQAGAELWADERSKPRAQQVPCGSLSGATAEGCLEAKARLDVSDQRRKLSALYRQGWNSYVAPTSAASDPTLTPAHATIVIPQASAWYGVNMSTLTCERSPFTPQQLYDNWASHSIGPLTPG
jgi:hypothetical protein